MLVQLIYASIPTTGCREAINAELTRFQNRNKERGLGGMILSHEKFFLQIIEGNRALVNTIFHKIQCDKRHQSVTLLRYTDVRSAEFAEWNFAVIEDQLEYDKDVCATFLETMIPDMDCITTNLSGSHAMAILRRAAMVALIANAPHRRKTDIKEIPAY